VSLRQNDVSIKLREPAVLISSVKRVFLVQRIGAQNVRAIVALFDVIGKRSNRMEL